MWTHTYTNFVTINEAMDFADRLPPNSWRLIHLKGQTWGYRVYHW